MTSVSTQSPLSRSGSHPCGDDTWPAPCVHEPVRADVVIPGSKSLTNRYLYLALLSKRPTVIANALHARDTDLMIRALETCGARVERVEPAERMGAVERADTADGDAALRVTPPPSGLSGSEPVRIECGLAGTVMRFMASLALVSERPIELVGDAAASARPMAGLAQALRHAGVKVDGDALPMTLHGPARCLREGHVESAVEGETEGGCDCSEPLRIPLDSSASSQFLSGVALTAWRLPHGAILELTGTTPSLPHVEMTLDVLRTAGIRADYDGACVYIGVDGSLESNAQQPGSERHLAVEPDLSNATPFLAAAMVTGGQVSVAHWPAHTTQAGDHIREIFTEMGGVCTRGADGSLTVTGPAQVRGLDRDLSAVGELVPTIAAVCACASGPSRLRSIGHLRGHETDRLEALRTELTRIGAGCEIVGDDLLITPLPSELRTHYESDGTPRAEGPAASSISPSPVTVRSYDDHRMATFGAIVGLVRPGTSVENVATTAKTFPTFVQLWEEAVRR